MLPDLLQVICRYGSHLCIASADGENVECFVMDVMSPLLCTKLLFNTPTQVGCPLSMTADVMADGRRYIRIVCSRGILVCHPGGLSTVRGDYSALPSPFCARRRLIFFRRMWRFHHRRWDNHASRFAGHAGCRRVILGWITARNTLACQARGYYYMCKSSFFSLGLLFEREKRPRLMRALLFTFFRRAHYYHK